MLLHAEGSQGNIPTGPLKPLHVHSLSDKVSRSRVDHVLGYIWGVVFFRYTLIECAPVPVPWREVIGWCQVSVQCSWLLMCWPTCHLLTTLLLWAAWATGSCWCPQSWLSVLVNNLEPYPGFGRCCYWPICKGTQVPHTRGQSSDYTESGVWCLNKLQPHRIEVIQYWFLALTTRDQS
jgi:hypothetical protein